MYQLTIAVTDNPLTLKTENRKLVKAVYELALEHPKELEVAVAYVPEPKPVKFKGLPAMGNAATPEPKPVVAEKPKK